MPPDPAPAARRLADRLALIAGTAGVRQDQIAVQTGMSQSTVSRIRTGRRLPTREEVGLDEATTGWLDVCSASSDDREDVADLLKAAWTATRSHARDGTAAGDVDVDYLVASSAVVSAFHPALVPGLMQTADYARRASAFADDVDAAVARRLARQRVLDDDQRRFRFVLGSRAMTRDLGNPGVLAVQHAQLAVRAAQSNIEALWLPDQADVVPTAGSPFTIYADRTEDSPETVLLEVPHGLVEVQDPADVAVYRRLFARLREASRKVADWPRAQGQG